MSVLERWQGRSVAAEPFEVLPESRELELVRTIYTCIYGLCIYVCVSVCPFCVLRLLVCNIVCVICVSSLSMCSVCGDGWDAGGGRARVGAVSVANGQDPPAAAAQRAAEGGLRQEALGGGAAQRGAGRMGHVRTPPSHPTQPTQTTHASNPHTLACTRAQLLRIA